MPSITIPSAVGSTLPPRARSAVVTVSIRSDSLRRSSSASRMTVVPSAKQAARATSGSSSIASGISAPPTSVAAQGCGADAKGGDRLAAASVSSSTLDLDAHPLEDRQQAGAGRVDVDPFQFDLASRDENSSSEEEGGRGDIGGDERARRVRVDRRAGRRPCSLRESTAAPAALSITLGVVAARRRLDHPRLALCQQAGEEQAGLDLGAGDRHLVGDAVQGRAADLERRQPILASAQVGAHLAQRHRDPVDRAAADRVVAVEGPDAALLPRQPTRQQPQQGAGVADVDLRRARRRAGRCPGSAAETACARQPSPSPSFSSVTSAPRAATAPSVERVSAASR